MDRDNNNGKYKGEVCGRQLVNKACFIFKFLHYMYTIALIVKIYTKSKARVDFWFSNLVIPVPPFESPKLFPRVSVYEISYTRNRSLESISIVLHCIWNKDPQYTNEKTFLFMRHFELIYICISFSTNDSQFNLFLLPNKTRLPKQGYVIKTKCTSWFHGREWLSLKE